MSSLKLGKQLLKYFALFIVGGLLYICMELLYDGSSDWTMFLAGSISFLVIGGINEWFTWKMSLVLQMLIGAIFITVLELAIGLVFNSDYSIWYYSDKYLNFKHQICLEFSCLWFLLSGVAIVLDDYLRYWLFHEEKPHYKIL